MPVQAFYFDGLTSRRLVVSLDIRNTRFIVTGDGVERSEHLDAMQFTDALGTTPRIARFPDGASCEIADVAGLTALLESNGIATSRVTHYTEARRWVAVGAVVLIASLLLAYRYGVPVAAEMVANRLPPRALKTIGDQALATLDQLVFSPTEISPERQAEIVAAFTQLRQPQLHGQSVKVLFRKSDVVGANAMALPSGDVIVTDGLLGILKDDRELLGVLLHESGHVARRHSMKLLLEDSVVQLFLAWYVGDVNTLTVTAPTTLARAKYSREFEQEADDEAAAAMRANKLSPAFLADALQHLSEDRRSKDDASGPAFLASHPPTAERIARLRSLTR